MKLVWAVVDSTPYDGGQTISLHENALDAYKAAGYFTEDGLPKYGNNMQHNDVEAEWLLGPGESGDDIEGYESAEEARYRAHMSIWYIPAMTRKQNDGKRITKHEQEAIDLYYERHGT